MERPSYAEAMSDGSDMEETGQAVVVLSSSSSSSRSSRQRPTTQGFIQTTTITTTAKENHPMQFDMGHVVCKRFADGWYKGEIDAVRRVAPDPEDPEDKEERGQIMLYHITYEDGDHEELTHDEVIAILPTLVHLQRAARREQHPSSSSSTATDVRVCPEEEPDSSSFGRQKRKALVASPTMLPPSRRRRRDCNDSPSAIQLLPKPKINIGSPLRQKSLHAFMVSKGNNATTNTTSTTKPVTVATQTATGDKGSRTTSPAATTKSATRVVSVITKPAAGAAAWRKKKQIDSSDSEREIPQRKVGRGNRQRGAVVQYKEVDDDDDDDDNDDSFAAVSDERVDESSDDTEDEEKAPPVAKKRARPTPARTKRIRAKAQRVGAKKAPKTEEELTHDQVQKIVKNPYKAGEGLAVINQPQLMFDDMIQNLIRQHGYEPIRQLQQALKREGGKSGTLRVATMCSGTESPILALDMIQNALKLVAAKTSTTTPGDDELRVAHVFSCEIEPFKQAFIERNYRPPILFRDIRELGMDQAFTAYGALVDVPNTPGLVDLLIAGTSCVDYSNLNNSKKEIEQAGESGQTFFGMMKWIEKAQPPIVIIENVSGAPWDKKVAEFEKRGYAATFQRLDTKHYYIPHTRQRGYLFAVLTSGKKKMIDNDHAPPLLLQRWIDLLKDLKRPASADLDAFMLPNDDPRVLRGRARLTAESGDSGGGDRAGRTDWAKCETRHQRARSTEELGYVFLYISYSPPCFVSFCTVASPEDSITHTH
jgi:site-specific DNA-cytosine methylase